MSGSATAVGSSREGEGKAAASRRILIVDDDTSSRTMATAQLSPVGYQLLLASNGEEALAAVEPEPPDLVLLDVLMPGMDGFEVCRRIRARQGADYIPIVLI